MDKHGLKVSLNSFEIDPKQLDINQIHAVLDANANPVLALYNYLLEKGTVKP